MKPDRKIPKSIAEGEKWKKRAEEDDACRTQNPFVYSGNIHIFAIIDSEYNIADVDPSKIHNVPRLTKGAIDTLCNMHKK